MTRDERKRLALFAGSLCGFQFHRSIQSCLRQGAKVFVAVFGWLEYLPAMKRRASWLSLPLERVRQARSSATSIFAMVRISKLSAIIDNLHFPERLNIGVR